VRSCSAARKGMAWSLFAVTAVVVILLAVSGKALANGRSGVGRLPRISAIQSGAGGRAGNRWLVEGTCQAHAGGKA
jgi:hypothetical protein